MDIPGPSLTSGHDGQGRRIAAQFGLVWSARRAAAPGTLTLGSKQSIF